MRRRAGPPPHPWQPGRPARSGRRGSRWRSSRSTVGNGRSGAGGRVAVTPTGPLPAADALRPGSHARRRHRCPARPADSATRVRRQGVPRPGRPPDGLRATPPRSRSMRLGRAPHVGRRRARRMPPGRGGDRVAENQHGRGLGSNLLIGRGELVGDQEEEEEPGVIPAPGPHQLPAHTDRTQARAGIGAAQLLTCSRLHPGRADGSRAVTSVGGRGRQPGARPSYGRRGGGR